MLRFMADSNTSSPRTGKDDIFNFLALQNYSFVGIIAGFKVVQKSVINSSHNFLEVETR